MASDKFGDQFPADTRDLRKVNFSATPERREPRRNSQGRVLTSQNVTVIDGDSIKLAGTKIRIHGIDAPEREQECTSGDQRVYRCGQVARDVLRAVIGGGPIMCEERDVDQYDRVVAQCWRAEMEPQGYGRQIDLARAMVRSGWALAFEKYSRAYVTDQQFAQQNGNGLWAGNFEMPTDFRARKRAAAEPPKSQKAPPDCDIKGNINRKGRKLYHLPSGRDYARTKITQSRGERWFCSEEEALAAGWQRAKR